jgi:hypothetical protein
MNGVLGAFRWNVSADELNQVVACGRVFEVDRELNEGPAFLVFVLFECVERFEDDVDERVVAEFVDGALVILVGVGSASGHRCERFNQGAIKSFVSSDIGVSMYGSDCEFVDEGIVAANSWGVVYGHVRPSQQRAKL